MSFIHSVLYILWFNWSFLMTNKFYKIQFARTPSKTDLESFFCKECGGLIVSSLLISVANSSYKRKDKHWFKILWSVINLFGILWGQMLVAIFKYSLFLKQFEGEYLHGGQTISAETLQIFSLVQIL